MRGKASEAARAKCQDCLLSPPDLLPRLARNLAPHAGEYVIASAKANASSFQGMKSYSRFAAELRKTAESIKVAGTGRLHYRFPMKQRGPAT